jgi:hypothetical protein
MLSEFKMKQTLKKFQISIAYQSVIKIHRFMANSIKKQNRKLHNFIGTKSKKALRQIQIMRDIKPLSKTFTGKGRHTFFGYYDLSPFNQDETKLLAMQLNASLTTPDKNTVMNVGYYELKTNNPTFVVLGQTTTWCWQQGCRLRWDPVAPSRRILYNRLVNGNYGAVSQDIETKEILRKFPCALYDIDRSGRWGVTLNFSRLQRLRPGYGYAVLPDDTIGKLAPRTDGVWLMDLDNGEWKMIFSLALLAEIEPDTTMKAAEHYVNHLSYNPSGTSFMFIHLWVRRDTGQRFSRLFVADADGSNLRLLLDNGLVSHYAWMNEDLLSVVSRISRKEVRYLVLHRRNGFVRILGNQVLTEDGHQTFLKNGRLMMTDTYPNSFRDQLLMLYDIEKEKRVVIDRFHVPKEFKGEVRCDLHPRVSPSERFVCVDTVQNGYRGMAVMDISSLLPV